MTFIELVKKEGIDQISAETNISTNNLEYLESESFEKLTRVKSLGFLLILEREYRNIDVAELREKLKVYFEENRPADENVVMVSKASVEGDSFSFFKWFVILAVLFGGWYLYSNGYLNSIVQNVEEPTDFFDDKKALESNVTEEDAKKNIIVEQAKEEPVSILTPIAPTEKKIALISDDLNKINSSSNALVETTKLTEKDKSTEEVVKEVIESADEIVNQTVASVETEELKKIVQGIITTVTIKPTHGALWFGFINIDTKKRKEFMKKASTPFDIEDGRWLLVTGHGFVDVVSDIKTIESADSKKHYFYIDKSEIKEIQKSEFREMNGRRGW